MSYKSQIFSCAWADLLGTDLVFSQDEGPADSEPLRKGPGYELIAATRLKLLGQKAYLTAKPHAKRRGETASDAMDVDVEGGEQQERPPAEPKGASLGSIKSTNPKVNADRKRTAKFLEKLMDVKRAKGETDTVRTVFSHRRKGYRTGEPRYKRKKLLEADRVDDRHEEEMQRLNRRVLQGDAKAMEQLQKIYQQMEDEPADPADQAPLPGQSEETGGGEPSSANANG